MVDYHMISKLTVYTDGGNSSRGGGVGAAAAIVLTPGGKVIKLSEGYTNKPTNNMMELAGVLLGLEYIVNHPELGKEVLLISDSEYIVKGASEWLDKWKTNGWKSTTGPVKNKPVWEAIDLLKSKLNVTWQWTKGHNGDEWNEQADKLATETYIALIPPKKKKI